ARIFAFSMRRFLKSGTKLGGRTVAAVLIVVACANPSFSQSPVPADKAPEQAPTQPAPAIKSRKFDDWYYRCTSAAAWNGCVTLTVALNFEN
ncbi:hypothetical protein ACC745_38185, partial [Rhizobium ruizarguesonis]